MYNTHNLPPRKTCPSCYSTYQAIPFVRSLHPDTLVYVTVACTRRARGVSERCGHPYAVVFVGGKVEFIAAPSSDRTFAGLEGAIASAYSL